MTKATETKPFSTENAARAPGAYLGSIRRKKQISREYLLRQLGLTGTLFDALETDDFQRLPGPVYVKGYLRRYAEIVGERVAPILAGYQAFLEREGLVEVPERVEPPQRPYKVMIVSALSFLLATSLVFGAILTESEDLPAESAAVTATGADGEDSNAAAKPQVETAPADDATRLTLAFRTDSWVEVVDSRDHILAVSLQREGTRLALEGKPPFAVTLGYGPGVTVSYLGEALSFEHDPETFSSKFVVGK